jgi:bifunctional enzyme CysN/CysC
MFLDHRDDVGTKEHWHDQPASLRLQPAISHVSDAERQHRYSQRPVTVLITGLSGSGKTTLALELEKRLFCHGRVAVVLDGQNMRFGISRDLGFSAEERSENLRRAAEVAKLLNDAGQICIASFVATHVETREKARQLIGPERFVHVHLSTPVEVCRRRDTSGRYEAADRGEITSFPGVSFPYDEPTDVDLVISTDNIARHRATNIVIELLEARSIVDL